MDAAGGLDGFGSEPQDRHPKAGG
ncbi:hypothetical protein CCHR01_04518 [Colletotrichum chrysophilum]|uniref:Uncharacterized protein n=1 Tax=Colletotrichum chrysophilum TaxID=1836956 RepID=A0AAD9AQQ6_9PEZI|nr:hypothetical protein CCHR01_04518 [Colletotrichum chrysophilum]